MMWCLIILTPRSCYGTAAEVSFLGNGAAYNLELNGTKYLLPANFDPRTRTCVTTSPYNKPGAVVCPQTTTRACASTANCGANQVCVSGKCACKTNFCFLNGACVSFPAPKTSCPAIAGFVNATALNAVVNISCTGGVASPARLTCHSNGAWSDAPVCIRPTTTRPPTTTLADTCLSSTSCSACTARSSCGWCVSSGKCYKGTSSGATSTVAPSTCKVLDNWAWVAEDC